jgi:glycosyltransferase involved in cell wall biosynthesis
MWQMLYLGRWLNEHNADVLIGVNHHFPGGKARQITYHLNVLRFDRPRSALYATGEVADRLRDWRARIALRNSNVNVFESEYLQSIAEKTSGAIHNPAVIYIGLDDSRHLPARGTLRQPLPHILCVTSPQPHKDNPTLIRMLAILSSRRPDVPWRLRIAGGRTADAFSDLKNLAAKLGVDKQVDWLGFMTHDQLKAIGSSSLCLASASRVESFCMVALEAMSWGCPAIVCDSTSMPESVGEDALLVPAGEAEAFADRVIRLWGDKKLRGEYVTRGLERSKRLTWTSAAMQFEKLF